MTVYIPQVMDYNVRSAEKFGELKIMLPDRKQMIFASSPLIFELRKELIEAVSETGVRGVLQVTERTGKEMFKGTGVEFDVTNQDHQIEAGTKYLAKHIKDWKAKGFGDQQAQQLATASYNTGFKRVSDAISETGKALPTMEEIEEAGNKLFPESNLTKDGKKIPFSKEEYKIKSKRAKSFREGMAHWKKIHYQDGELQEFGVEGGDEFVTAGTPPPPPPPPSEPLSLGVDDFEDEEKPVITKTDLSHPGGAFKKVVKNAQKPPKPINVDKEWDKLLDTVVANDDVFLMGLSEGTESLKIAAKAFEFEEALTPQLRVDKDEKN